MYILFMYKEDISVYENVNIAYCFGFISSKSIIAQILYGRSLQ